MLRSVAFGSSLSFVRNGYAFGLLEFRRLDTDAFRTRLLGIPFVVMEGADAARFFYEGGRFGRSGAMPRSVSHLLQDEGSVQSLEGEQHRARKELFLGLLSGASEATLIERFVTEFQRAVEGSVAFEVRLIDFFTTVLTRAVCDWAGLPQRVSDELERNRALALMIERAGTVGPLNWSARLRRRQVESVLADTVERVRAGTLRTPDESALSVIAGYREHDPGHPAAGPLLLDPAIAAVELLNILRPVVAVGRFMVFAALALERHPGWRARFAEGDTSELRSFVNEVRRFYPFFPVIAGRATRTLEWHGHTFSPGDRAILDLYATTHDPAIWGDPQHFRPSRFTGVEVEPNTLIPQGGGHYSEDHRCPGEPATIALLEAATSALARSVVYEVPNQDLRVSLRRFPALPESGFIVRGLRGSGDRP